MSNEIFYTVEMACSEVEGIAAHFSKAEQEAYICGYDSAASKFGGDGYAVSEDCIDELDVSNKEYALRLIGEFKDEEE